MENSVAYKKKSVYCMSMSLILFSNEVILILCFSSTSLILSFN